MSRRIATYLDSNAGAPLSPRAVEALQFLLSDRLVSNPSSIHSFGQNARRIFADARERVAASLGRSIHAERLVFTSSGTEANQLAIRSELEPRTLRGEKTHWITTGVEHSSVRNLVPWAKARGVEVSYLPVDSRGLVDPAALEQVIRPETALVSLIWVNNETGVILDLPQFARQTQKHGIALHVDAAQAWGKLPVDFGTIGAQWVSLSGHKIGAPAGIGVLWSGGKTPVTPMIPGTHEKGRRGGTENLFGAVALGAAAQGVSPDTCRAWSARIEPLRNRLEDAICKRIAGVRIQGKEAPRVANTSNLRFEGVKSDALVMALDLAGFCVSAGAACSSGAIEPSAVLQAMGLTREEAASAIRVSLADELPWERLEGFVAALEDAVGRMR